VRKDKAKKEARARRQRPQRATEARGRSVRDNIAEAYDQRPDIHASEQLPEMQTRGQRHAGKSANGVGVTETTPRGEEKGHMKARFQEAAARRGQDSRKAWGKRHHL
jgi:hypothetical protein